MEDDVPSEVKQRRLQQVIDMFRRRRLETCIKDMGSLQLVLLEGPSRRSTPEAPQMSGRCDGNKVAVMDDAPVPASLEGSLGSKSSVAANTVRMKAGDYVLMRVTEAGPSTLKGTPICR